MLRFACDLCCSRMLRMNEKKVYGWFQNEYKTFGGPSHLSLSPYMPAQLSKYRQVTFKTLPNIMIKI